MDAAILISGPLALNSRSYPSRKPPPETPGTSPEQQLTPSPGPPPRTSLDQLRREPLERQGRGVEPEHHPAGLVALLRSRALRPGQQHGPHAAEDPRDECKITPERPRLRFDAFTGGGAGGKGVGGKVGNKERGVESWRTSGMQLIQGTVLPRAGLRIRRTRRRYSPLDGLDDVAKRCSVLGGRRMLVGSTLASPAHVSPI